jgi:hypothetical protein
MVNLYIGIFSAILLLVIILLFWLMIERSRLKRELTMLTEYVNRNNTDIAGLCSAAITIDTRLGDYEERLEDLSQIVSELHRTEIAAQPYHSVIQKIRAGASVTELMQNSGLSRDEAVLLIRLHGTKLSAE